MAILLAINNALFDSVILCIVCNWDFCKLYLHAQIYPSRSSTISCHLDNIPIPKWTLFSHIILLSPALCHSLELSISSSLIHCFPISLCVIIKLNDYPLMPLPKTFIYSKIKLSSSCPEILMVWNVSWGCWTRDWVHTVG